MRRFALLCALIAALGCATVFATTAHAGCPPVQRYTVGPNGDPGSTHVPHVPAGWRVPIPYPADVLVGDHSRAVAVARLDRAARDYRQRCGGRIEVYAYSLGASAASLVVDRWQSDPRMSHDTAAYFWGNPRQRVSGGYGGIETVGLPHIAGRYTWRGQYRLGPILVRSICNAGDIICRAPRPLASNPAAAWSALVGYAVGGRHAY